MAKPLRHSVVIIGSGFGGSMTALTLAREFKKRSAAHPEQPQKTVMMIERGTWWTTPVGTVQDKEVRTYDFLLNDKKQPVQYWSSQNHFKGFIDIVTRCLRRGSNKDGLFDMTTLGPSGLLGLFRGRGDGVSILRANGVGGGSLVYSNITIRPPDLIFKDSRWPLTWSDDDRHDYYNLARDAIGTGILFALNQRDAKRSKVGQPRTISGEVEDYVPGVSITVAQPDPVTPGALIPVTFKLAPGVNPPADLRLKRDVWLLTDTSSGQELVKQIVNQGPLKINPGLNNIVTRSSRLDPYWKVIGKGKPFNPRGVKQLDVNLPPDPPPPAASKNADPKNALWIDRARVFQTAVSGIADDFGAVDLAIADLPTGDQPYDPKGAPKNYCERQGRCNIGCLPGARHTLNKQLMAAILGRPNFDKPGENVPPIFDNISLDPLSEVDFIEALPDGGYAIHYDQQDLDEYGKKGAGDISRKTVYADVVIVAAGCMGTNEILLRSRKKGLPYLSDEVGCGFSTNGDYIAFLEKTKEQVRLTRGPVTTSYGHFNTTDEGLDLDPNKPKFHTLEDQGVPPALASLLGVGLPLIRSLAKGRNRWLFLIWAVIWWALKQAWIYIRAPFVNNLRRQELFRSDDEIAANIMCVVAMGREAAKGQFRLGGAGETSLRVKRTDGLRFHEDPVYKYIETSLEKLAENLRAEDNDQGKFVNPFMTNIFRRLKVDSITLSHPLGGCRMASDVTKGVVDEVGRVFYKGQPGDDRKYYQGLYIADGSIIPTALGVNPTLTIAALSLRIADHILKEV